MVTSYSDISLEKKILDRNKVYFEMIKAEQNSNQVEEIMNFEVIQWLKKHNSFKDDQINLKDQIEFAKKLFFSWDDDGSGVLEIDEISEPLIALGLAPDKKFVAQLIKSLDSKFLNTVDEDLKVTLKDFLKIFRTDKLKKDFILKPEKRSPHKKDIVESI